MNPTLSASSTTDLGASLSARHSVTWVSRIVMLGATSIVVGILWDISWHRTIGRDSFWTPAHMAIYLGGLLGGLTAGWLVFHTTFLADPSEREAAVRLWGLRAPIGAWVTIWGCFAMLISAPFDNWWHDAYGLDVKILSPPHAVLALGMWSVVLGALLLVLRQQNNTSSSGGGIATFPGSSRTASSVGRARGQIFFIYGSGVLLAMASVFLIENSFPNQQRSDVFYRVSAVTYPLYLVGMARASRFRWSATLIALVYIFIIASMAWVLPMFPGEPKLGPISNRVDHFVPLPFPLLLVVPAVGLDLLRHLIGVGRGWRRDWLLVISSAIVFVALFSVTQWYFSKFLLSPMAHNWFFAADRHWGYTESLGAWRHQFWDVVDPKENPPATLRTFAFSLLAALLASRVGLTLGNWMSKVRR
jgi:hypothetical protein